MALSKAEKIKKNELGYEPPVETFELEFGLKFKNPLRLNKICLIFYQIKYFWRYILIWIYQDKKFNCFKKKMKD